MCENIYNSMENVGFVATLYSVHKTQLHTRKAEVIMQGNTLKHPPVKLLYQSTMTKHCTSIDFLKTLYTKGQIHKIYREV